jgi:putative transposase
MDIKGHCFPKSIIVQAVYFKLRFSLSYRDVEEIMRIRGVEVDHATIQRWVFKFMPEIVTYSQISATVSSRDSGLFSGS